MKTTVNYRKPTATINLYGEADTNLNARRMVLTTCRYVLTNYGPFIYGLAIISGLCILTLIGALS